MIFSGLYTALITPFDDGKVDYDSLAAVCNHTLRYARGLVVLGTTGEPCTLTEAEQNDVVRFIFTLTDRPIVVGVTANDTAKAVRQALHWQAVGAKALLVITPYYNRCTPEGLVAHYRAIAEVVDIPIILYNVPSRTGVNITVPTLSRLLSLAHVVGVKEATADALQITQYAAVCHRLGKTLMCGEDCLLPAFRAVGAAGVISAAANAVPSVVAEGCNMSLDDVHHWSERHLPLLQAMFAEVNPIGVKAACYHLGLCRNQLRLPLTPSPSPDMAHALAEAGFAIVNQ